MPVVQPNLDTVHQYLLLNRIAYRENVNMTFREENKKNVVGGYSVSNNDNDIPLLEICNSNYEFTLYSFVFEYNSNTNFEKPSI